MADRHVIACNYAVATSIAAQGALAYVCEYSGGSLYTDGRINILVRSRGSRWVQKWEDLQRLGNFRLKTLPPEHPRYADARILRSSATEEQVAEIRACAAQFGCIRG